MNVECPAFLFEALLVPRDHYIHLHRLVTVARCIAECDVKNATMSFGDGGPDYLSDIRNVRWICPIPWAIRIGKLFRNFRLCVLSYAVRITV